MVGTSDASIAGAVVAAEHQRCGAMLANDLDSLAAILDDRLCFSHATGAIDDKPAYLAKMAAGRIDYLSIDWPEQQVVRLADDAALLTGIMVSDVSVDGTRKQLHNRVLAAWSSTGGPWRMIAFQSTPIKS